jgi:hypothetical protein
MKAIIIASKTNVQVIDLFSSEAGSRYLCEFPDGHKELFNDYELEFKN